MGQALYRKYRSKSFPEVIGQDPITATLATAVASGRISHAYLLAGPKGVGKTSVARILAHEVNNLPYTDESVHLDIIEIDAASNRRIDEIRDIREKVHIAPSSAKYKVYIIDEVHMLTKEAFNALLKTLEEPPAHCIFILATTEAHKLPETIISRTQRFNFRPIGTDKTVAHLKNIAKKEKIDIEPGALGLLAEHSGGSFRDAISMLDQLSGSKQPITGDDVRQLLGLPPSDSISKLTEYVRDGATNKALNLLTELKEAGNSPVMIAAQLAKKVRGEIIAADSTRYDWASGLLKNLLDVSGAKQPYELLEIAILDAASENIIPASNHDKSIKTLPITSSTPKSAAEPVSSEIPLPKPRTRTISNRSLDLQLWPEVLTEIKKRAASIYTALRLAEPEANGNILTLTFQFPLHKNKVAQARHIQLISDVVDELSGIQIEIRCILSAKNSEETGLVRNLPSQKTKTKSPDLENISNIFGSAEMVE